MFSNLDVLYLGSKRDPEDRIIPRSVDADDSDVDIKSDDDRYLFFISSTPVFLFAVLYGVRVSRLGLILA